MIHSMPLTASSDVEIHKFRWAIRNDLNNTRCAFPSRPWRFPNDTLHPDPNWSTLYGCEILLGAASTPEEDRITCRNNNSLFMLIGNPGMIWHPLSGQCINIKMGKYYADNRSIFDRVEITLKTLITSCACDMNSSSVALFKYDKNKPQRLTFLETDPTTNKTQEWLIRGDSSFLQVVPKLKMDGISLYEFEPVFHKVL